MVRRSTWILLGVFVVLVGLAWLFQRYQANKATDVATATPTVTPVKLYALTSTQVNEINIAASTGDKIDLYRDPASSNWAIANLPADQADSVQIESINEQLLSLSVQDTLTESLPLDSVGLVTPAYTISMTTTDGTQLVTYVGSQNAVGDSYYARVDSGQVVLVRKVELDTVLNLLKNPPLLPTPTPEVTASQISTPVEPVSLGTPTP
jgi:Domain of unknown function (DUF4340)